jgi:hypothetical protein
VLLKSVLFGNDFVVWFVISCGLSPRKL